MINLRPGRASAWASAGHIACLNDTLAQLLEHERGQVLVRTDTGGCSQAFLHHLTDLGLEYSVGFPGNEMVRTAIEVIPEQAWRAAIDSDGEPREGAPRFSRRLGLPEAPAPSRLSPLEAMKIHPHSRLGQRAPNRARSGQPRHIETSGDCRWAALACSA